ncbi:MAG: hypothetical protein B7X56_06355 [Burkholderiales bacterium 34-67-9]|nr:MAG: hypothetical protein B7X56_06355 [Burkholderiales bacterium 34-67-9]
MKFTQLLGTHHFGQQLQRPIDRQRLRRDGGADTVELHLHRRGRRQIDVGGALFAHQAQDFFHRAHGCGSCCVFVAKGLEQR